MSNQFRDVGCSPNPTTDQINYQLELDLSNYAHGIYLLHVQTDTGTVTGKIVRE